MERIPITRDGLKALNTNYAEELKHQLINFYVSAIATSVVQYAKTGATEYLYRVKYNEMIPYIKEILFSLQKSFPDSEIVPINISPDEHLNRVSEEFHCINAILINWS